MLQYVVRTITTAVQMVRTVTTAVKMVRTITTVVQTVLVEVISLLLHTLDERRFDQESPGPNSRPLHLLSTEAHSGFPQYIHTNIKTAPLPSTSFPVQYSLTILPICAIH